MSVFLILGVSYMWLPCTVTQNTCPRYNPQISHWNHNSYDHYATTRTSDVTRFVYVNECRRRACIRTDWREHSQDSHHLKKLVFLDTLHDGVTIRDVKGPSKDQAITYRAWLYTAISQSVRQSVLELCNKPQSTQVLREINTQLLQLSLCLAS